MNNNIHNPDVLSCLANLSSDEVFTPPEIANAMLDLLPQELFSDPSVTFLDPCCKSGVFLREIAKRLNKGLEAHLPNREERLEHIFRNQLLGIAITELTSLLARRGVYCSKYPNGPYSVVRFDNADGNIRYKHITHTWRGGKCVFCGASQAAYGEQARKEGLESHAYEFIHANNPNTPFHMNFDVIIGNPPYQLNDGGNGVSAIPIFQYFVEQAKRLNPKYLSMIIPARWYSGGKGLDNFRDSMLNDKRLKKLVDYESSKDCFSGVNIAGGICYFLWKSEYKGKCEVVNIIGNESKKSERHLDEFPILIRSNTAISIVHKVLNKTFSVWSDYAYPRNPFGFSTNYRGRKEKRDGDIEILTSEGFSYISRKEIIKNIDIIDHYKILIGRLVPSNGELNVDPKNGYKVITDTKIIGPHQINTETYLDIGVFPTDLEAKNFEKFLKTKFVRYLLKQAISSLNVNRECFRFVPKEDFTQEWTDKKLYKKYGLTKEEQELIEKTIRPMEG